MAKDLKYFTNLLKKYAVDLDVLYVEDDKDVRDGISMLLQKFFKTVTTAVDGQDGLEKFKEGNFDLVLTDISMPNMNGVEMSSEIKEIDYEQTIVVISAHNEGDYLISLINIGIDAFLLKPIQTEMLVKTLSRVCRYASDLKMLEAYQNTIEDSYVEIMQQKDELQARLNAKLKTENKNIVLAEAIKEVEVKIEEEVIPQANLQFMTKEFTAQSARDFVEGYPTDLDIYSDRLLEIGENLDILVNNFIKNSNQEGAVELSNSFAQYADVLSNIPEFINLNYAITQLSTVFEKIDCSQNLEPYFDLILAISQELERWRISIFETQEADNIHYLDNSLISDCTMLESFVIGSQPTDDDGMDDMFF